VNRGVKTLHATSGVCGRRRAQLVDWSGGACSGPGAAAAAASSRAKCAAPSLSPAAREPVATRTQVLRTCVAAPPVAPASSSSSSSSAPAPRSSEAQPHSRQHSALSTCAAETPAAGAAGFGAAGCARVASATVSVCLPMRAKGRTASGSWKVGPAGGCPLSANWRRRASMSTCTSTSAPPAYQLCESPSQMRPSVEGE